MKVWFKVLFEDKGKRLIKELWVKVDLPALMPVGSIVYMPSPAKWGSDCLSCRVDSYNSIGRQIECEAVPVGVTLGDEGEDESYLAELIAIGYSADEPQELKHAFESIKR